MIVLLIFIVILLIVILRRRKWSPTQISNDIRAWNTLDSFTNKQEAAQLLASVNKKMITLLHYLERKYHIDCTPQMILAEGAAHTNALDAPNDLHNIVDHLLDNYNPDVFYENTVGGNVTSYTVNKGQAMYICLRDAANPTKLVTEDSLLFVMIHEAAHIANYRGWGHEQLFWEIFRFLLHEAELAGVYNSVDFAKHPITYCGLVVDYSPMFDPTLRKLWLPI